MNAIVKKVLDAVNELIDDGSNVTCVGEALDILAVAAGGSRGDIVDLLDEDEDDGCDGCKHGGKCDDDEDLKEIETVASFDLTTDSQGRITLTKEIVNAIEDAQDCSPDEGITIAKDRTGSRIEIAFGEDIIDNSDGEYDSVKTVKRQKNGQVQFSAGSVFSPDTDVTLEIYSDGVVYILEDY